MQISGMSHRNNMTVKPCCSHDPAAQNNGRLDKIKQSTLTLVERDNLDHVLVEPLAPCSPGKQEDTVFSPPVRQFPLHYWLRSRLKATEYKAPRETRSCNGLKPSKKLHTALWLRGLWQQKENVWGTIICLCVTFCSMRLHNTSNLQKAAFQSSRQSVDGFLKEEKKHFTG